MHSSSRRGVCDSSSRRYARSCRCSGPPDVTLNCTSGSAHGSAECAVSCTVADDLSTVHRRGAGAAPRTGGANSQSGSSKSKVQAEFVTSKKNFTCFSTSRVLCHPSCYSSSFYIDTCECIPYTRLRASVLVHIHDNAVLDVTGRGLTAHDSSPAPTMRLAPSSARRAVRPEAARNRRSARAGAISAVAAESSLDVSPL